MKSYKDETIRTYNSYPSLFDEKFQQHFDAHVKKNADNFIALLKGKKILDLGSGPGNHAAYFKEKGFEVLCLDFSDEMLALCRKKGLDTIKMDIEQLDLPDKFDGIWAYASLLHIPKKNAGQIADKLSTMLVPGGVLALALKEGEGEQFEDNEKYPGTERWFVYYTDDEVRNIFSDRFNILQFGRDVFRKYSFINYLMKKK